MCLLHSLCLFVAHFDFSLTIKHLHGVCNTTADQLSRNNLHPFFLANPQANIQQTPLPQELLQIVAVHGPDWTSPAFSRLFRDITSRALPHTRRARSVIGTSVNRPRSRTCQQQKTPCCCLWATLPSRG